MTTGSVETVSVVPPRDPPSLLPRSRPFPSSLTLVLSALAGYGEGDALNLSSKSDSRDDLSDAPTPRDDKDEALSDADDLDDKNGKPPLWSVLTPPKCLELLLSSSNHSRARVSNHSPLGSLWEYYTVNASFFLRNTICLLSASVCSRRCNPLFLLQWHYTCVKCLSVLAIS